MADEVEHLLKDPSEHGDRDNSGDVRSTFLSLLAGNLMPKELVYTIGTTNRMLTITKPMRDRFNFIKFDYPSSEKYVELFKEFLKDESSSLTTEDLKYVFFFDIKFLIYCN